MELGWNAQVSRRCVLRGAANGFGALALQHLLVHGGLAKRAESPLAAKAPHFAARAKSVIFIFNVGAPSSMDTFDPKPALNRLAGEPMPESFGKVGGQFTDGSAPILGTPWRNSSATAAAACPFPSCFPTSPATWTTSASSVRFSPAASFMRLRCTRFTTAACSLRTRASAPGRPTAWARNRRTCRPMSSCRSPRGTPEGGTSCWSPGFLPSVYQGTLLRPGPNPILDLKRPAAMSAGRQRRMLDFLQQMNRLDGAEYDSEMAARVASYELAFRMQSHAPEAVDLAAESARVKREYGLEQERTRDFGARLLLARRLVERGVRFIQIYSGGGPISMQWDAHKHLKANHEKMAGHTDRPIAALLGDLKQRGLLDETLVIWGAEFGRLPTSESGNGRDHNPHGYTMWFAGGGVKGGRVIGATDELGLHAVEERCSMRDFHATILHLLGLDQHRLWYLHNGRHEKLTDFGGAVIEKAFS